MTLCAVFVCNKNYLNKFQHTCQQLLINGKYEGDICLVIGDDLLNDPLLESVFIKDNNIIVKHFPDICFSDSFLDSQKHLVRHDYWYKKLFQYHKLYLFHVYFKKWDNIFYIDCGVNILSNITPMINECTDNVLYAHSDAYPTYEWKLHNQFSKTNNPYYEKLSKAYNLDIDYFQTTIMLYSTKVIQPNTYRDLLRLTEEYPISITNDQGIISLYFTSIQPYWKQIKIKNEQTHFYDYLKRDSSFKYIMLKLFPS